ncbi:hypothetical protein J6590_004631 [Homalodisca vitripennis]|nr:hypothetical protein J6590_004631 [Homalodisca vitripennis]
MGSQRARGPRTWESPGAGSEGTLQPRGEKRSRREGREVTTRPARALPTTGHLCRSLPSAAEPRASQSARDSRTSLCCVSAMVTGGSVAAAVPCGGGSAAAAPQADTTSRRPTENRRLIYRRQIGPIDSSPLFSIDVRAGRLLLASLPIPWEYAASASFHR